MGSPKLMDPGPNLFSSPLKREPESFPSLSEIGSSLQSQVTGDILLESETFVLSEVCLIVINNHLKHQIFQRILYIYTAKRTL